MARTYREAGVDEAEARRAVEAMARHAQRAATPNVLGGLGGFGALYRFNPAAYPDPVLVSSTDGVGTKLMVAVALDRYDTIGVDLVNQSVNDIAVAGADPLFFLDYLAVGRLRAEVAEAIVAGVARACAEAGAALVGGETAQLPDLFRGDDLDLAGFVVGVVASRDLVDGSGVEAGDALLGVPSSGLHTNGYTLARRILPEATWGDPMPGAAGTVGDALLVPHRSYLAEIRALRRSLREAGGDVRAMAHITGGGWEGNVPRTLPAGLGVEVDTGSWQVPPIFSLLQRRGDIDDDEMVRTFNVGIGLTAVVPQGLVAQALAAVPDAVVLGRVVPLKAGEPRVAFR